MIEINKNREENPKKGEKNVSTEYVYMLVPVWGFDAGFSSKKIYICNFQNG